MQTEFTRSAIFPRSGMYKWIQKPLQQFATKTLQCIIMLIDEILCRPLGFFYSKKLVGDNFQSKLACFFSLVAKKAKFHF